MNELNNIKTTIIDNIKQTEPIGQTPLQPDNIPQQVQQNQLAQSNWFNMIPVIIKELKGVIIVEIKQAI